jgi:hypothetical protein
MGMREMRLLLSTPGFDPLGSGAGFDQAYHHLNPPPIVPGGNEVEDPAETAKELMQAHFASEAMFAVSDVISTNILLRERSRLRRQNLNFQRNMADLQVRDVELRGRKAIEAHQRRIASTIGTQRAALASQGVDVSSGTPLALQEETGALGAEDLAQIESNIFREAFGIKAQSVALSSEARFENIRSRGQRRESIAAGGTRLVRVGTQIKLRELGV